MAKAGRGADQYMLRFPDGLRERIKAYAERKGTSINSEIIRVLEIEFPEQFSASERLNYIAELLVILSTNKNDQNFRIFSETIKDTITGIISGKIYGVDENTRKSISDMWDAYNERMSEDIYEDYLNSQVDRTKDEVAAYMVTGRYEKYAIPLRIHEDRTNSDLRAILPPSTYQELAEKLRNADLGGAADVIKKLSLSDLEAHTSRHEDPDHIPF